jgi:hypothetical protein
MPTRAGSFRDPFGLGEVAGPLDGGAPVDGDGVARDGAAVVQESPEEPGQKASRPGEEGGSGGPAHDAAHSTRPAAMLARSPSVAHCARSSSRNDSASASWSVSAANSPP